jgi:subtilisin
MFDGKFKGARAVVGAVVLVGLVIATTPEAALARAKTGATERDREITNAEAERDNVQARILNTNLATEMKRVGLDQSPTARIDGKNRALDVDIAIIDTGIARHSDLNIAGGINCSASPGSYDDTFGHGTWLAGIAAAKDNRLGVVGVAPGARLWALRVIDNTGGADVADVVCALDWVTAHANTIDVVVFGIGDVGVDDSNCGLSNGDLLHQAVCRVQRVGVTMVAGAGNAASNVAAEIPGSYDEVITVSTMNDTNGRPGGFGPVGCEGDADDIFAPFSNFGADVDLAAPGICMKTTTLNNQVTTVTSNSLSAAMVGGAAALVRVNNPRATPANVRAALVGRGENGALAGDIDGFAEPVLNVRGL